MGVCRKGIGTAVPVAVSPAISPLKDQRVKRDGECEITAAAEAAACATPKGERFRIPEIKTCPPAPKKRRVTSSSPSFSLQRTPIAFFLPPDIELFFESPAVCRMLV